MSVAAAEATRLHIIQQLACHYPPSLAKQLEYAVFQYCYGASTLVSLDKLTLHFIDDRESITVRNQWPPSERDEGADAPSRRGDKDADSTAFRAIHNDYGYELSVPTSLVTQWPVYWDEHESRVKFALPLLSASFSTTLPIVHSISVVSDEDERVAVVATQSAPLFTVATTENQDSDIEEDECVEDDQEDEEIDPEIECDDTPMHMEDDLDDQDMDDQDMDEDEDTAAAEVDDEPELDEDDDQDMLDEDDEQPAIIEHVTTATTTKKVVPAAAIAAIHGSITRHSYRRLTGILVDALKRGDVITSHVKHDIDRLFISAGDVTSFVRRLDNGHYTRLYVASLDEQFSRPSVSRFESNSISFIEKPKPNSYAFTCRRCGSNEMYVSEAQTRSADEGATVYVLCTKCLVHV